AHARSGLTKLHSMIPRVRGRFEVIARQVGEVPGDARTELVALLAPYLKIKNPFLLVGNHVGGPLGRGFFAFGYRGSSGLHRELALVGHVNQREPIVARIDLSG